MKSIIFLFLFSAALSFGQVLESVPGYDAQVGIVFHEIPIQGSPYLDELYKVGNTIVNGKEVRLLMRYNAYSDQIELKDRKQNAFNMLRRKDLEAHFDGKRYVYLAYNEDGIKKEGYFNPLNSGKIKLYFKPKKVFVQAEKPDHGYDKFDPPEYKDVSGYYVQRGDQQLEEVRLAKGPLLRFMKDKSPALKKYISEQHLNPKNEKDAVRLINYYNSLK
jgi:hypothetical protein